MRFLKCRQGWTPLSSRKEIPLSCTCVGFILCLCLILASSLQLSSNAAVVSPGVKGLRTTRTLQCFGHLHAQMTQLILLQAHMEHLESHLFTSVSTCFPAGSLWIRLAEHLALLAGLAQSRRLCFHSCLAIDEFLCVPPFWASRPWCSTEL